MSDAITIDVSEWEAFARDLNGAKPKLEKRIKAAMLGSLNLIQEWITSETPVNYGTLRGSFGIDLRGTGTNLQGETVTGLLYGLPVETGRKAGRMPPVSAIALWAKRKLGLSGDELTAASWGIARAIARRGTKGAHMVEQAYQRAVQGKEIDAIFEYELDQFLKELAR